MVTLCLCAVIRGTAFRAAVAQRPTCLSATRRALHAGAAVHPFESVLVSDALDNIAIELLEARGIDVANKPGLSPEDLLVEIAKHDALIVRSGTQVTPEVLAAAKKLKFVGRAGTGVDNINIPAATKKGVIVMNVPGGNTNAAAELAFAMIMAVSRNIAQGNESLRAGRWDRKKYGGYELSGKTVCGVAAMLVWRMPAHVLVGCRLGRLVSLAPVASASRWRNGARPSACAPSATTR